MEINEERKAVAEGFSKWMEEADQFIPDPCWELILNRDMYYVLADYIGEDFSDAFDSWMANDNQLLKEMQARLLFKTVCRIANDVSINLVKQLKEKLIKMYEDEFRIAQNNVEFLKMKLEENNFGQEAIEE